MNRYAKIKYSCKLEMIGNIEIYHQTILDKILNRVSKLNSNDKNWDKYIDLIWDTVAVGNFPVPSKYINCREVTIGFEQYITYKDFLVKKSEFIELNDDEAVKESMDIIKSWMNPIDGHENLEDYCYVLVQSFLTRMCNDAYRDLYYSIDWFKDIRGGFEDCELHTMKLEPVYDIKSKPSESCNRFVLTIICSYPSRIIGSCGRIIESIRDMFLHILRFRIPDAELSTNLHEYNPYEPGIPCQMM